MAGFHTIADSKFAEYVGTVHAKAGYRPRRRRGEIPHPYMPGVPPPELADLLHAADSAQRDRAWGGFLNTHSPLILRVARSLGGDYDSAMDRYAYALDQLRQDDFRRLRNYAPEEGGKFDLWLVVVVRRLCLDHYRQRYGRSRSSSGAGVEAQAGRIARRGLADLLTSRVEPSTLADTAHLQPDAELAAKERRQALEAALGRLGPRDRLLLKLRFEDDLSAREIAGLMLFSTPFHVYRRLTSVVRALGTLVRQSGIEGGEA